MKLDLADLAMYIVVHTLGTYNSSSIAALDLLVIRESEPRSFQHRSLGEEDLVAGCNHLGEPPARNNVAFT